MGLIEWLKELKQKKVAKAKAMLESGEYDRKIEDEKILAKARIKENKIRTLRRGSPLVEDIKPEVKKRDIKFGM